MRRRRSDRPASSSFRLDVWVSRWVPGGRIVLERLDRVAVAYLERRYVGIGRDSSTIGDSTNSRGA